MSFRAGNLKDAHLPLSTLNGEVLFDSACVRYLGHFICSDLTDDTDILRQRRCLSIQGNVLLRKGPSINSNVHHNPNNVRIDSDPLPPPLNPNSQNIEIKMVLGGMSDGSIVRTGIDRSHKNQRWI